MSTRGKSGTGTKTTKSPSTGKRTSRNSSSARKPRGGRTTVKAEAGEPMCLAEIKTGKKAGTQCDRPSGYGTDHPGLGRCNLHGGNLPGHIKHTANAELSMLVEEPVHMDPNQALLWCVSLAAQDIRWINAQIAELEQAQCVPLTTVSESGTGPQGEIDKVVERREPARVQHMIRERFQAEERLARYSKMALDAGVAERLVTMAEQMADLIAPLLASVLAEFGIDPIAARPAIEKHMRDIEGTVATPRSLLAA